MASNAPKPTRLFKTLEHLRKAPAPVLPSVKGLRLKFAQKNAHFGARHFFKEEIPRIVYNNPHIAFDIQKVPKTKEETWDPEMTVEFADGETAVVNMQQKHSSKILMELMTIRGGVYNPPKPAEAVPKPNPTPRSSDTTFRPLPTQ